MHGHVLRRFGALAGFRSVNVIDTTTVRTAARTCHGLSAPPRPRHRATCSPGPSMTPSARRGPCDAGLADGDADLGVLRRGSAADLDRDGVGPARPSWARSGLMARLGTVRLRECHRALMPVRAGLPPAREARQHRRRQAHGAGQVGDGVAALAGGGERDSPAPGADGAALSGEGDLADGLGGAPPARRWWGRPAALRTAASGGSSRCGLSGTGGGHR